MFSRAIYGAEFLRINAAAKHSLHTVPVSAGYPQIWRIPGKRGKIYCGKGVDKSSISSTMNDFANKYVSLEA
jgi:hypothetical protein